MALSPEERASLPASMQVPERNSRKVVEHTPAGSFADMSDLAEKTPLSYRSDLGMHGVKQHINCEATESADGHEGPASHLIRLPGERSDQVMAVCAVHHTRLTTNALERGEYDVASRRINPEDVELHHFHRAQQYRLQRTEIERGFYLKGMRGDEILYARSTEELGKGGGKASTHFEEVMARTTPQFRASTLESALEKVRAHGGHNPPASAAPTVDFDGEDVTLGESYSRLASLRRKVAGTDGSVEGVPKSSTTYDFNKAGVPNTRGGRKPKPVVEDAAKDESDVAPSNKGFLPGKVQRKAIKVTMDQLPITAYPTETPGAPDDAETISASKRSQKRSTNQSIKTIALNTEADRLRGIEAKKTKMAESRNKAFKVDWNDVPRPE